MQAINPNKHKKHITCIVSHVRTYCMKSISNNKAVNMKSFTATQLKRHSSPIYNELQKNGPVIINNHDRGDMVLMSKEDLDKLLVCEVSRAELLEKQA